LPGWFGTGVLQHTAFAPWQSSGPLQYRSGPLHWVSTGLQVFGLKQQKVTPPTHVLPPHGTLPVVVTLHTVA
jgi:hypothetical protein